MSMAEGRNCIIVRVQTRHSIHSADALSSGMLHEGNCVNGKYVLFVDVIMTVNYQK